MCVCELICGFTGSVSADMLMRGKHSLWCWCVHALSNESWSEAHVFPPVQAEGHLYHPPLLKKNLTCIPHTMLSYAFPCDFMIVVMCDHMWKTCESAFQHAMLWNMCQHMINVLSIYLFSAELITGSLESIPGLGAQGRGLCVNSHSHKWTIQRCHSAPRGDDSLIQKNKKNKK